MFLNRITPEEKTDFIFLAIKAAEVNGVVEEEEKELLQEYCREMMIDMPEECGSTIEELEERFSGVPEAHKRIVVFELLGLMYVDGVFDEAERDFVRDFVNKIGMPETVFEKVVHCMDRYVETVTEVSETILLGNADD